MQLYTFKVFFLHYLLWVSFKLGSTCCCYRIKCSVVLLDQVGIHLILCCRSKEQLWSWQRTPYHVKSAMWMHCTLLRPVHWSYCAGKLLLVRTSPMFSTNIYKCWSFQYQTDAQETVNVHLEGDKATLCCPGNGHGMSLSTNQQMNNQKTEFIPFITGAWREASHWYHWRNLHRGHWDTC